MKTATYVLGALALACLLAGVVYAQATGIVTFPAMSATGTSAPVDLTLTVAKHTVQVTTTGSPTGCAVQLEGTLDDLSTTAAASVTWANLSGSMTCTSSTTFHVTDRPIRAVRINLTTLSGGSSPKIVAKYAGVR